MPEASPKGNLATQPSSRVRLAPAILVWERQSHWERVLKSRLAGPHCLVRPCRSAADVWSLSSRAPGSVVVIDFDAQPAAVLQFLAEVQLSRIPLAPLLIASPEWADLEWVAREAGAVGWYPPGELPEPLVQLCQQWLAPPSRVRGSLPTS